MIKWPLESAEIAQNEDWQRGTVLRYTSSGKPHRARTESAYCASRTFLQQKKTEVALQVELDSLKVHVLR